MVIHACMCNGMRVSLRGTHKKAPTTQKLLGDFNFGVTTRPGWMGWAPGGAHCHRHGIIIITIAMAMLKYILNGQYSNGLT